MKNFISFYGLFLMCGLHAMEPGNTPTPQATEDALRTRFVNAQKENNLLKEWYHNQGLTIPQTLSFPIETLKVQSLPQKSLTKEDIIAHTYVHSSIHLATPVPIFPEVDETELKKLEAENTRLRRYAQTQGYDAPQPSSSLNSTHPIFLVEPARPTSRTYKQLTPAGMHSLLSNKSSIQMKPADCSLSHK